VNAYEVRQAWCLLQVNCARSMPERFKVVCIPSKALYKCPALPFGFIVITKKPVCITNNSRDYDINK